MLIVELGLALAVGFAAGWYGRTPEQVIKEVPVEIIKVVERLVTPPEVPSIPAPSIVSHDEYRVERVLEGHPPFNIYFGPSGGDARRWWEYVHARKEPGEMFFYHNGELRDTWPQRQ